MRVFASTNRTLKVELGLQYLATQWPNEGFARRFAK
jgi:hypothetical protein